jgi:hypothetical protein
MSAFNFPADKKTVTEAARDVGVDVQKMNAVNAQVMAVDIGPILDLFDWNAEFFSWSLRTIDVLQAFPLAFLMRLSADNAAKVAAFLQKVEDEIKTRRNNPPTP